MLDKEAIQELAKAEAISAAQESIDSAVGEMKTNGTVALPDNFTVHDLESKLPNRRRARGTMETCVVKDFAKYVGDHKAEGACVFIDQDAMNAVAVLNLGTPENPGHADNRAKLIAKRTAAYKALQSIVNGGRSQQVTAEFFEDWPGHLRFFNESGEIAAPKAIAAVRKVTIEALRKLETEEKQLGASRSTFESVKASSGDDPIPTTIYFRCLPYAGLDEREFVLRLSIQTTSDKPAIVLRVVNQEQHDEQMAQELADAVTSAIAGIPVLIGKYAVAA